MTETEAAVAAAVEEASAARMEVDVVVGEAMMATSAGRWIVGFDGTENAARDEAGRFVCCCESKFVEMFQL